MKEVWWWRLLSVGFIILAIHWFSEWIATGIWWWGLIAVLDVMVAIALWQHK